MDGRCPLIIVAADHARSLSGGARPDSRAGTLRGVRRVVAREPCHRRLERDRRAGGPVASCRRRFLDVERRRVDHEVPAACAGLDRISTSPRNIHVAATASPRPVCGMSAQRRYVSNASDATHKLSPCLSALCWSMSTMEKTKLFSATGSPFESSKAKFRCTVVSSFTLITPKSPFIPWNEA